MLDRIKQAHESLRETYRGCYLTLPSWQIEITGFLRAKHLLSPQEDKEVWLKVGEYLTSLQNNNPIG